MNLNFTMGKIVAIGGKKITLSEKENFERLPIDKEIISLTKKQSPRILFIPTASSDSEEECLAVKEYYKKNFNCAVSFLKLIKSNLSHNQITKSIMETDIVYVGGGNTLKMLKIWKKKKIDKILFSAFEKGIILSGTSAGAICWFKHGNSDSLRFSQKKSKKLIRIKGLGIIPFMVCPHYDSEEDRKPATIEMIKEYGETVIALDDCSALEYIDGKYKIINSKKGSGVYQLFKTKRNISIKELSQKEEYYFDKDKNQLVAK